MNKTTVTGLEEKWEVFLVYLIGLLGFIFSFMKYDYLSENIKFHYRQAGTLWLANIVINMACNILGNFIGGAILIYFSGCISIVFIVFIIITIVKAFEGTRYEIPVISDLSKSIWE